MLLEIYDIKSWKNFFDLIHDSTTVVEMKLDQEKCSMSLLNNSHICFYTIEYNKDFFTEYQVDDTESVLLFVADFYNIIKSANNKDRLELTTTDTSLKIVLEHDNSRRVFEIPLAEEYGDTPQPPNVPCEIEFNIPLSELKQPCTDLDKIIKTDRFKMILSDNQLNIVSPDDSMTKYNQLYEVDTKGDASSTVNLTYISDLQKLKDISDSVTFRIGNDLPLCWSMVSPDEFIKVDGLIAPILEDN